MEGGRSRSCIWTKLSSLPLWKSSLVCYAIATWMISLSDCACSFPSSLTSTWVRSRDTKSLTFTSSAVSGMGITYNSVDLGDFSCDTLSSARYILASAPYNVVGGTAIYYICWQLVYVSDKAYILYELSDVVTLNSYNNEPGSPQPSNQALDVSTACPKSTSTTLFTTLVSSGATTSNVGADCPTSVLASFTYGTCASATLQACSDNKVIAADYDSCSETVFGSAGGQVSCMGSAVYQGERYVNLYKHDSGNDIICWKIPDSSSAASISTVYYSGDCTTTSGASTSLDLTLGEVCPENADDSGGGGSSAAAIGGGAVGGILAVAAVVLLAVFIFKRKNEKMRIGSADSSVKKSEKSEKSEKSDKSKSDDPPEEIVTAEAENESKIPEDTPRVPHGLPPLNADSTTGTVSGKPLRG